METDLEKIKLFMDVIFIEKYNPKYIASAVVFYDDGEYEGIDPETAIYMTDNYQQSILDGVRCINFDFNYHQLLIDVNKEYKKLIKNIV